MRTKKYLCLILSICMILTMLPVMAFAETYDSDATAVQAGKVARIGDAGIGQYYATLKEAVDAVNAADTTVTLIADVKIDKTITLKSEQNGLVIDGGTHAIETTVVPAIRTDGVDVTLKNATLNVKANRLISCGRSTKDVTCTIENCTITTPSSYILNAVAEGTVSDSYGKVTWIVKDTNVTLSKEGFMFNHEKRDVVLTLDNSTITRTRNETKASNADTGYVFYSQNLKSFTLNLKNGSKVTSTVDGKTGLNDKNDPRYGIVCQGDCKTTTVNLEKDTELRLGGSTAEQKNGRFFSYGNTFTVTDAGAKFILSKESRVATVTLPEVATGKGYGCTNGQTYVSNVIDVSAFDRSIDYEFVAKELTADIDSDETAVANGYTCRVGAEKVGTYYSKLEAAVKAVQDGETITLIADLTSGAIPTVNDKTFTIDGNSHTATISGDAFTLHDCHVTVKNLKLKATGNTAFVLRVMNSDRNSADLTLENCNVTANKMVFKHQTKYEGTKQTVTLKNSEITSGKDDLMLSNDTNGGGQHVSYYIDGSTLTKGDSNGKNNTAMFIVGGSKAKHTEIHVTGNSRLIAANKNTSATENVLFKSDNTAGTFDLYLDNTAVLELAPAASNLTDNRFLKFTGSVTASLHDDGATWKIQEEAVRQGAYYPGFSNAGLIGWSIGGILCAPVAQTAGGAIDKSLEAADGLTISPVMLTEKDFYMVDGASVRLDGPTGIRFKTRVSSKLLALLGDDASFGTYIALTSKIADFNNDFKALIGAGSDGTDYVDVERTKWALENQEGENEYCAVLYNIPETKVGYTTAFSAISYMTIHYANDMYVTFYTVYDAENNSRTMYAVASAAIEHGETTEYLQSIVDACR